MAKKCFGVMAALTLLCLGNASAQDVVIKTNLIYDATLNANLAIETRLAPLWSAELSGNLNLWKLSDDRQWRNWVVQPELRRWFCNTFSGHFVGVHVFGGQYNIGHVNLPVNMLGTDFRVLKDTRAQGWFVGAGLAYGYDWIINRHWTIEAEIGLGWAYTRYDRYPCAKCGKKIEDNRVHNYVGPTKAALNLIYAF